jgi:integrase
MISHYTIEQCKTLVSDEAMATPLGKLVAVQLYTGMRLEEAVWLRWSDIKWSSKRIIITLLPGLKAVKRDKERIVLLVDEFATLLRSWAGDALGTLVSDGFIMDDVIRSAKYSSLYDRMLEHLGTLKIGHHARPFHSLRASFAGMVMATRLAPEDEIQTYMGHTTRAMMHRYTQCSVLFREEVRPWGEAFALRPAQKVTEKSQREAQKAPNDADSTDGEDDELFVLLPSTDELLQRVDRIHQINKEHPGSLKIRVSLVRFRSRPPF